jgi:hypothetical protein
MAVRLVVDRRSAASFALEFFQVGCLAWISGVIGLVIGIPLGAALASAITRNALLSISITGIGAFLGIVIGVWIALNLMAR